MNDQATRDRITRVEKRFELLEERLDERSRNLREAFDEVDRRIDSVREDLNSLLHTLEQGA